jgi:hypothetical protein
MLDILTHPKLVTLSKYFVTPIVFRRPQVSSVLRFRRLTLAPATANSLKEYMLVRLPLRGLIPSVCVLPW